jgi:hypothetical protein
MIDDGSKVRVRNDAKRYGLVVASAPDGCGGRTFEVVWKNEPKSKGWTAGQLTPGWTPEQERAW